MKKKMMSCLLAMSMVFTAVLTGCGGDGAEGNAGGDTSQKQEGENTSGGEQEEGGTAASGYKFAGDIVGQGAEALDNCVAEEEFVFQAMGSQFQIYNDNFTADTQGTNIQTMASAGYDGMMVFGWNATLYSTISNICKDAKVPFIMFDQIPREEEMIEKLNENEFYVGSVGVDNYKVGSNVAQSMLDAGIKKTLILGGSVGDVVHDARVEGFTDTFEAGGGEIVGVARCTDPSEATAKEDDLISGNADAEATYCLTGDFAIAAIAALENHSSTEMALYCSDATSEVIPYIIDGTITRGDGGSQIATILAATLLQNYVSGNVIKDPDGKAPNLSTIVSFEVNADNAETYKSTFLTGHPLTKEAILKFIDSGANYQTYVDYISNYSLEEVIGQ